MAPGAYICEEHIKLIFQWEEEIKKRKRERYSRVLLVRAVLRSRLRSLRRLLRRGNRNIFEIVTNDSRSG